MPSATGGFRILNNHQILVVDIESKGNVRPTVYTTSALSVSHSFPVTISGETEFWFAAPAKVDVSVKRNGVEIAGNGSTANQTLELDILPGTFQRISPAVDAGAEEVAHTGTYVAVTQALMSHKLGGTDEPGAFIAWTADDGYTKQVDYFAALDSKGIKGTLFLTQNWVNKEGVNGTWNDTYITQAQVQTIANNGHELATHGVNHESYVDELASNGAAALESLIGGAKTFIQNTFGVVVRAGAYPGGASNNRVREIMGRLHDFYRGTKGLVARNAPDPYDVYAIDVQNLTEAAINAHVDTAVAGRQLVVFLVHGGMSAADITKYKNVMDYATSLGVRQGTFSQGMSERTMWRSAGSLIDAQGNTFAPSARAQRFELSRADTAGDFAFFDIDELTNVPYFDASGGNAWEFRKSVTMLATFRVSKRKIFWDGVTTSGSPVLTSASASFAANDVGLAISGTNIPGGTTILSVDSTTQVTLSQNATGTGSSLVFTIDGRPALVTSAFAGNVDFYNSLTIRSSITQPIQWFLNDTQVARIDHTQWRREGAGGTMTIDTGTGGSNLDVKAFRLRFIDHTGARRIALANAVPTDASINTSELVMYFDDTSGAAKVKFKAKDAGGTVRTGEVALA